MNRSMHRLVPHATMLALLAISGSALACCPGDGNTSPKAPSQGLGQEYPAAPDLAADPAWSVYKFQRDGVTYLQVNDAGGTVRAAVGQIGDTQWVLPVGIDANRVGVQDDALPAGTGAVVYRDDAVEIRRYQTTAGDAWSVTLTGQ